MTQHLQRASPIHDLLEHLQPQWGEVQRMAVALSFQAPEVERSRIQDLALCDFSCLPRMALKGPGAVDWLEQAGIRVPKGLYEYSRWNGEGLVLRTDRQEVFLEDGPMGDGISQLTERHASGASSVYRVERQDTSFLLSGARTNEVLVETCGHDFRQPGSRLVMTRVAGVSCALLPLVTANVPGFRIWLDCSYAIYLWKALLEIIHDRGGDAVGIASFYPELFA